MFGKGGAKEVADPSGDGEAEEGREDVNEGGGLDEDAHGGDSRGRVQEHPAQKDHDLVPPPLEADGNAARDREVDQGFASFDAFCG